MNLNIKAIIKSITKTLITIAAVTTFTNPIAATSGIEYETNYDSSYKFYTNTLSNNSDLEEYARQFLKENFNLTLDIPISLQEENTEVNGTFYYNQIDNKALEIIIYKNKQKDTCTHDVERTLIHELVHYALFIKSDANINIFNDGSKTFEKINFKFGGLSNISTTRPILETKIIEYCCE